VAIGGMIISSSPINSGDQTKLNSQTKNARPVEAHNINGHEKPIYIKKFCLPCFLANICVVIILLLLLFTSIFYLS
jgi:hypothetical protein